jgi:hypothetical protein
MLDNLRLQTHIQTGYLTLVKRTRPIVKFKRISSALCDLSPFGPNPAFSAIHKSCCQPAQLSIPTHFTVTYFRNVRMSLQISVISSKSRFPVVSTRNTEFILVLIIICLFIIVLSMSSYLSYYYYYYYFVFLLMI